MERDVELLEKFLEELNHYCESVLQTEHWYESRQKDLESDQQMRRIRNEDQCRKNLASSKALQEKAVREKGEKQQEIRDKILEKKRLLQENIETNCQIRDRILCRKNEIMRPEFFQYAYRYREYGDFYPQITRLEEYRSVNLEEMAERINDNKTGLWLNRLKALFKSEDMMVEYASFANLLGKAQYLCEVENDALREQAQEEIALLEGQLSQAETVYRSVVSAQKKLYARSEKEQEQYRAVFEKNCEEERKQLNAEYRKRAEMDFQTFEEKMKKQYPAIRLKEVYHELSQAQNGEQRYICEDGIPLPVKLSQLWFKGSESISNGCVRQLLERDYEFMIREGRLSIPGIA